MNNLIILTITLISLSSMAVNAETPKELELYQQAKSALENDELTKAEHLAEQAIAINDSNSPIKTNIQRSFSKQTKGRKVVMQPSESFDINEYKPKDILQQVAAIRAELNNQEFKREKRANPPQLTIQVSVVDEDNDQIFEPLEKLFLDIKIANIGNSMAESVQLLISNDDDIDALDTTVTLSNISPNASAIKQQIDFVIPKDFDQDNLTFSLALKELDRVGEVELNQQIQIKPLFDPMITVTAMNRNQNELKSGISSPIYLNLTNSSASTMRDVSVSLNFDYNNRVRSAQSISTPHISLLAPDQSKPIDFALFVNGSEQSQDLGVSVVINARGWDKPITKNLHLTSEPQSTVMSYSGNSLITQLQIPPNQLNLFYYLPPAKQVKHNELAIIIGNSQYQFNQENVKFAQADAKLMAKIFQQTLGLKKENIWQFNDITQQQWFELFGDKNQQGKLQQYLSTNNIKQIHIYYSGHGAPASTDNWQSYLMPVDARVESLDKTGIAINQFMSSLNTLNIPTNLYLDACFSGESAQGDILKNISPAHLITKPLKQNHKNLNVFSAAKHDQVANWFEQAQHGLFTYVLANALTGQADSNLDEKVTTNEVKQHLEKGVASLVNQLNLHPQTPSITINQQSEF